MPILKILADTKAPGTCRSCGAAITWAELVSGKRMPFEGREIVASKTEGSLLGGEAIEHIDTGISPTHFEKCPHADQHRRPRS